jgi:hypothetical protein
MAALLSRISEGGLAEVKIIYKKLKILGSYADYRAALAGLGAIVR